MIYCLSVETVIEINCNHTNNGGLLRDRATLESALARPMHTFGGVDLHPSILEKAAILLHSLARTQSFIDGNKRTAWLSCVTFLGGKGIQLADVDDIAADFVIELATNALDARGAVDWLLDHLDD